MVNITTRDENNNKEHRSPSIFDSIFGDRMLNSFFGESLLGSHGLQSFHTAFPKVDVTENSDAITVTANVPGIEPDDINIEVGDDHLTLSGTMKKEQKDQDKDGRVYRFEREYGEFHRQFALPARVDAENIEAKTKDGVLTITLPKSEEAKTHSVKIERE